MPRQIAGSPGAAGMKKKKKRGKRRPRRRAAQAKAAGGATRRRRGRRPAALEGSQVSQRDVGEGVGFGDDEGEDDALDDAGSEMSSTASFSLGLRLDTSQMDDLLGDDLSNPANTPRRRNPDVAPERVSTEDIVAYQKLAALPRPSMPGDPPRLQGVRVGRFRLDLHDYEEWQGDVGIRVSSLGEKAIEHMRKSGETSNSEGVSQLVQNIGREAFELTLGPHRVPKLVEPADEAEARRVARQGHQQAVLRTKASRPRRKPSRRRHSVQRRRGSTDSYYQRPNTRGLYVAGKGAENGGGDDDELDSDGDWDTSEWGKEDVESACMALLDEIESHRSQAASNRL